MATIRILRSPVAAKHIPLDINGCANFKKLFTGQLSTSPLGCSSNAVWCIRLRGILHEDCSSLTSGNGQAHRIMENSMGMGSHHLFPLHMLQIRVGYKGPVLAPHVFRETALSSHMSYTQDLRDRLRYQLTLGASLCIKLHVTLPLPILPRLKPSSASLNEGNMLDSAPSSPNRNAAFSRFEPDVGFLSDLRNGDAGFGGEDLARVLDPDSDSNIQLKDLCTCN